VDNLFLSRFQNRVLRGEGLLSGPAPDAWTAPRPLQPRPAGRPDSPVGPRPFPSPPPRSGPLCPLVPKPLHANLPDIPHSTTCIGQPTHLNTHTTHLYTHNQPPTHLPTYTPTPTPPGLTSQPNLGAIVNSLAGTALDTGISQAGLLRLSNYWWVPLTHPPGPPFAPSSLAHLHLSHTRPHLHTPAHTLVMAFRHPHTPVPPAPV
jgi:hypothetical protein